jgi:hypothetical protein
MAKDQYWASNPDPKECFQGAIDAVKRYYDRIDEFGLMALWRKSHRTYHSGLYTGGQIAKVGSEGEMRWIEVNHYGNFIRHTVALTTANRQEWDAKAINSDFSSLAQCKLASGVLDYYWRNKRFEQIFRDSLWSVVCFGRSGVHQFWDPKLPNGGDVVAVSLTPDYLISDVDRLTGKDDWFTVRELVSKWELIARYPQFEDAIKSAGSIDKNHYIAFDEVSESSGDMVEVYTLYHERVGCCPNGRQMTFLENNWLSDGPLDYQRVPVHEFKSEPVKGTKWGYTLAWDLLPIQEYINGLYSTIASGQAQFGLSNVLIPEGSNISVDMLSEHMREIRYNSQAGKPEVLKLLETPAEIPKMIPMLIQDMQVLSGINAVQRGQPDPSLKSGTALAMVQSMAIQFNSVIQGAYTALVEDCGTAIIKILQKRAAEPRVAMISGKNKSYEMRSFTGQDLSSIDSVTVDIGSPMTRTAEQKVAMVKLYSEAGVKLNIQQLITLGETGRVEPLYEGEGAELGLIRDENEVIMKGEVPEVIATDDHIQHIIGHSPIGANVKARKDDAVMSALLEHNMRHINAAETVDPRLLAALGYKSLAPAGAPPGPPGLPPPGPDIQMPEAAEVAPGVAGNLGITRPNMPNNPLTGEEVQIAGQ